MAIVVSHLHTRFDALVAQAERQAPLADLIELRLDQLGHPGLDALRAAAKRAKKPLIAACPARDAFGHFEGTREQRLALLRDAAQAGFGFVDVDWRDALDLGALAGKCHKIVSRHVTDGTPEDLAELADEIKGQMGEGDIAKLVTHARTCEDGLRMLAFLRTQKGLVGFCSGEAGSFTRVLATIFGSPFTYAAAAQIPGQPLPELTAPGQIRVNDLLALLPPGGVHQGTAVFGVVGNPVRHSWSPRVHGMALKHAQLDAVYVAFEPADCARFLALATDEVFRGFSITAPFKSVAYAAARARDGACERIGAANTLVRDGKHWRASNTDVDAVRETLERALRVHSQKPGTPVALAAARVLVLGTGGAARAAVGALVPLGAQVAVAGRARAKADQLARELGASALDWSAIAAHEYDVLVHATPVGSLAAPGALPIPAEWIRAGTLVLDAVYRPLKTPLLVAAMQKGCTAVPGGEWFVRQAGAQFKAFTGVDPDQAVLRGAFEHALAAERGAPAPA
ncbi:MAG: type I 3-dehydroquinate dehydratase [Planctomycetota bacterium]|nr:MAG: type I 3-dehydroquinate dehydratase [Planctomycetota bacterium]